MIFTLILKNLKILFRNPFTILLIILAPILLMFVIGLAYSGNILYNVNLGMINTNSSFFDNSPVNFNFKEFKNNDFKIARDNCLIDLERKKVNLCIFIEEVKDENNQISNANIIYYLDETKPKLSDIIISSINRLIDYKTKQISTKTVSDIFSKVKDTVKFMNESKKLVDQIQSNLTFARKNLEIANLLFQNSKQDLKLQIDNLNFLINNLKNQIIDFNSQKNNLETQLNSLTSDINSANNQLISSVNSINTIRNGIVAYSLIDPNINSYVNTNTLSQTQNSLNSLTNNLNSINNKLQESTLNLNYIADNSNKMIIVLDNLSYYLNNSKSNLDEISNKLNSFIDEVKQKENEVKNLNNQIEQKLNYFTQLSNRDASKITEPITKKYETFFKNFKRIHQLSPTVVILILLFIGLLLSNVIVSLEINSKAYFRNLISPVRQRVFILALFFTSLIIIFFQILFLFIVLTIFFGIPIFSNLFYLLIVIFHVLLVFILIGIFLAYFFSTIQISILVTTFLMLFLFLLSNIIVPINLMPQFIANIVQFNPVVIGEDLIRKIFFFPSVFQLNFSNLIIFYLEAFILILLIWYAKNRRKLLIF